MKELDDNQLTNVSGGYQGDDIAAAYAKCVEECMSKGDQPNCNEYCNTKTQNNNGIKRL